MFTFKKSLFSEITSFFHQLAINCTKSGFCQARLKIKVLFFEDFFKESVKSFYKHVKGNKIKFKHCGLYYRLWACDSSSVSLPNNASTRTLGVRKCKEKEVASVKLSVFFDVKAQIIAQVSIIDKSISDLFGVIQSGIENIPTGVIAIYDRGYGALLLGYLHSVYDKKYVVRLKTDFSNVVKAFIASEETSIWVNEKLGENAHKSLNYLVFH